MIEEASLDSQEAGEGSSKKDHRFSLGSATHDLSSLSSDDYDTDMELYSPSPFQKASILSKLFFIWPKTLMEKKGTPISEATLPDVIEADTSTFNLQDFQEIWNSELERAGEAMKQYHLDGKATRRFPPKEAYPNLPRAIVKHFICQHWYIQPCFFISSVCKLVQAYALGCLLQSIERRDGNSFRWAGLLSLSGIIAIVSLHHAFFFAWHKG